jgi:hypothetical protein
MNSILSLFSLTKSPKDLEICSPEIDQKPPLPASIHFLYKLTGLWFISVAAGSVLCSIPLSAIGLPIIITVGVCSMMITFVASTIIKVWIYFIKLGWKTLKQVFYSPFTITSYFLSTITSTLFGRSPEPISIPPVPLSRRFSSSTTRSLDSYQSHHSRLDSPREWRYNDLDRSFDGILHRDAINPKFDTSRDSLYRDPHRDQSYRDTFHDQTVRDRDGNFKLDTILPSTTPNRPPLEPRYHLNPTFHILLPTDKDRIEICAQLYSLTTNIPMDKTGLVVGRDGDTVHGIISLWNEPGVNEPLEVSHLIGFCQVNRNIFIIVFF